MKSPEPQPEHQWLTRLVGVWRAEGEGTMPDGSKQKMYATETVSAIGDFWIELRGLTGEPMPGQVTLMTLGYDIEQKKYVGTWIGSMMSRLWVYDVHMEPSGNILNLDSEGPDWVDAGKTALYRDQVELISDDERVLRSMLQREDGSWTTFMSTTYHRVK